MTGSQGSTNKFVLYHYTPSVPAALIFVALFGAFALIHLAVLLRFRASFYIAVVIGCALEAAGYGIRIVSSSNPHSVPPYAAQTVLILVAPLLFAATIYMTLARIINGLQATPLALIVPAKLTKLFVTGDILCFLIQAGGGGMQAVRGKADIGRYIVLGGLVLQIVVFCVFVAVAWHFHVRYSNRPLVSPLPWKKNMAGLYAASALILVRSVLRVVEFAQGNDGYLASQEWFSYVFDAAPMAATVAVLLFIHGGKFVRDAERVVDNLVDGVQVNLTGDVQREGKGDAFV